MKRLFLYIIIAMITNVVIAQKVEQVKWIIGTWKITAGNNIIIEQWQIKDDSTLVGKSLFLKNGTDTMPQERIELAYRKNEWFYIPTAQGQNNNQPVPFRIVFLKGTEFISENPAHDFPQRIAYRRIKDQLFASIEGKNNGKYSKQNFDFSAQ